MAAQKTKISRKEDRAFRGKIERWRKENKFSQGNFKKSGGVSQSTLSKILQGGTESPSKRILLGIANTIGCDLEWLLDESKGGPLVPRDYPQADQGDETSGEKGMKDHDKLKRWMEETQTDEIAVARKAGVDRVILRVFLDGKYTYPTHEFWLAIARTIDCYLEWFLDESKGWPPVARDRPHAV